MPTNKLIKKSIMVKKCCKFETNTAKSQFIGINDTVIKAGYSCLYFNYERMKKVAIAHPRQTYKRLALALYLNIFR